MVDEDKFIMVSLDDEKSKAVADVLSSKTCKTIIGYLAENKEASEKDLADKLDIPLNTVEYNLKKLIESGFVQRRKNFFWSKKGKKIVMYELSNKSIIISHKKPIKEKIKSIIPPVILTAVGAFAIWVYGAISASLSSSCSSGLLSGTGACAYKSVNAAAVPVAASGAIQVASAATTIVSSPLWEWFLLGGLIAIFIFSVINWRKL
jgi:predicted transcriptional regulator